MLFVAAIAPSESPASKSALPSSSLASILESSASAALRSNCRASCRSPLSRFSSAIRSSIGGCVGFFFNSTSSDAISWAVLAGVALGAELTVVAGWRRFSNLTRTTRPVTSGVRIRSIRAIFFRRVISIFPSSRGHFPGFFSFFACFERNVATAERDAELSEEVVQRDAAGKDPHEVVRDLLNLAVHLEHDRLGADLHRIRAEHDIYRAFRHALFDPLRVAILDAAESVFAIRQHHLIPGLLAEAHGSFDRAVAAAYNEDLL